MIQDLYLIVHRPDASKDIAAQTQYYRTHAHPDLALRWERSVLRSIHSLATLPHRGAPVVVRSDALTGLRRLPVEGFSNHFVFYLTDQAAGTVTILRMLHGARDIHATLHPDDAT